MKSSRYLCSRYWFCKKPFSIVQIAIYFSDIASTSCSNDNEQKICNKFWLYIIGSKAAKLHIRNKCLWIYMCSHTYKYIIFTYIKSSSGNNYSLRHDDTGCSPLITIAVFTSTIIRWWSQCPWTGHWWKVEKYLIRSRLIRHCLINHLLKHFIHLGRYIGYWVSMTMLLAIKM